MIDETMKKVQGKTGEPYMVKKGTPCHPGVIDKNGKVTLPRPYDPIEDADILEKSRLKADKHEAEAPLREVAKVIAKRNDERGDWREQMHYLLDNGFDAFKQRDDNIKANNPKPSIT